MAYAVVHHFPGGTKAQYEAAVAAVHPEGGAALPEGQLVHFAGPSREGWVVVAVMESEEAWVRFRDGVLMPAMAQGVAGGFEAMPQETTFEVDVRHGM